MIAAPKTERWVDDAGAPQAGTTVWSVGDGSNFAPSKATFMVNYRVDDLHSLLSVLRTEGCQARPGCLHFCRI